MNDKVFKDFILQSGLVLGLVFGIVLLVTYFMGVEYMVAWWVTIFNLGLAIGAPIYYGVKWRQFNDGFLDFKTAFTVIFAIFAVSALVSTIFTFTLYTIIDPELPEALYTEVMESTVSMLEKFGTPESEIDKAIQDMQDAREDYGLVAAMEGYGYWLIFGAFIALIGGAIIKKNPPVFDQE